MFILDDLALAPLKGFMWLVRELHGAAEREFADERERVMRQLQSLHMKLEAGQIDEAAFDDEEALLLDRLDELDGLAVVDSVDDDDSVKRVSDSDAQAEERAA
ncbi:MAG: gas vesicle protein GvpG [Planctomycetota bacterium]